MIRKNNKDIAEVMSHIKMILDEKPSTETMLHEIQMMRFKIRPLQGDFSLVNLRNSDLIETLWSLGKLDDIFQKEYKQVAPKDREALFKIYNNFNQKLQQQLNKIHLKQEKPITYPQSLEMEIFKERLLKKKIN